MEALRVSFNVSKSHIRMSAKLHLSTPVASGGVIPPAVPTVAKISNALTSSGTVQTTIRVHLFWKPIYNRGNQFVFQWKPILKVETSAQVSSFLYIVKMNSSTTRNVLVIESILLEFNFNVLFFVRNSFGSSEL